jgi:hypothetical protein
MAEELGSLSDCYVTLENGKRAIAISSGGSPVDVANQDQTTPSIEHFLYRELNDVVILNPLTKGQNTIDLSTGHGFTVPLTYKEYLNVYYEDPDLPGALGSRFNQFAVVAVNGDTISITPSMPYDLDTAKITSSKRVNVNQSIDAGSLVTPIKYKTRPPGNTKWDITRFIIDMILTSAGDDGKFGNLPPLTNGVFFGFEGDLFTEYLLAIFDNGGFRATAYDVQYTVRSGGAGDFGMAVRKTSAGMDKLGVAVRLEGETNDHFVSYVQDALTGIVRYRVKIMGHIVED